MTIRFRRCIKTPLFAYLLHNCTAWNTYLPQYTLKKCPEKIQATGCIGASMEIIFVNDN